MRGSLDSGDGGAGGLSPCAGAPRNKKRFPGRWSLRQLIYSSPLARRRSSGSGGGGNSTRFYRKVDHSNSGKDSLDGKSAHTSKDNDKNPGELLRATSKSSMYASSTKSGDGASHPYWECPLCLAELSPDDFCELNGCGHRACVTCFQQYLRVEITESRVCIACPECLEPMHPNEIKSILNNPPLFEKYEDFMVRRVLAVDPDTRWCPAPDCSFAVIASECASCPKLRCERPGCHSFFCYHCKAEWHPNQTCDAARAQRSPNIRSSSVAYSQDSQHRDDIKPCPRCQVLIVKMDDGSCNHMMCAVCGAEFCWLCMKEINDLHFLSPSGCTFWGKKPWSRKKKILWQLGTLVGAPIGIALVAGITVPAMVIGIPVWVGKKLFARYRTANRHKRNAAIVGGVIASVMISPLLAGLAVGIGVPILLFYVYGVVPVSLCRSGGCGGSTSADESPPTPAPDTTSVDAISTKEIANPSIGEASLSLASGSHRDPDRESASTVALAGSLHQATQRLEVQADLASAQRFSLSSLTESVNASIALDDGGASVRALAGSIVNYKPTNGSDSCSCVTTEDCTSERVRFDDNVNFIVANQAEKTSIGSSCSFRARCSKSSMGKASPAQDTLSADSICIDMDDSKTSRKLSTQAAVLRSQFFHSINECKPATKILDDKTIIEVSNETLDKTVVPVIKETKNIVICQLRPASSTVSLDEKLESEDSSVKALSNESLNNSSVPLIQESQSTALPSYSYPV